MAIAASSRRRIKKKSLQRCCMDPLQIHIVFYRSPMNLSTYHCDSKARSSSIDSSCVIGLLATACQSRGFVYLASTRGYQIPSTLSISRVICVIVGLPTIVSSIRKLYSSDGGRSIVHLAHMRHKISWPILLHIVAME